MNYKVLEDFRGSPDGCRVIEYKKGQILTEGTEFSSDLANAVLAEGWVTKLIVKPKKIARAKKSKK